MQNELVFMVFGLVLGLDLVVAAAYRPLVSKIPVISPPAARSTAEVRLRKAAVFNDFCQTDIFIIFRPDLHPICGDGRTVTVDERSEASFSVPGGPTLP